MAIQIMVLDPDAVAYTDDEIVGKVNAATANISRASSVTAAARPLVAGEVTETELGALAVTEGKIGALAITEGKIGALAVTTGKIGALAVTDAELGAGAVIEAKLGAGAVTVDKLGALAVTEAKLNAGAVTVDKLGDVAVTNAKLATTAAKDNLDALADTARGYINTTPLSGEYKVIDLHRNAAGDLEITYDDVPEA